MKSDGLVAAVEKRGDQAAIQGERSMSEGVNAGVNPMETVGRGPPGDRAVTDAG